MIKKILKSLLFTFLYLAIVSVFLCIIATYCSDTIFALSTLGGVFILPLIFLITYLIKKDLAKKTPVEKQQLKVNLIIMLISLMAIAILIPLFIFVFIPLFNYIIDFFVFLFTPNIIGYTLIN